MSELCHVSIELALLVLFLEEQLVGEGPEYGPDT